MLILWYTVGNGAAWQAIPVTVEEAESVSFGVMVSRFSAWYLSGTYCK